MIGGVVEKIWSWAICCRHNMKWVHMDTFILSSSDDAGCMQIQPCHFCAKEYESDEKWDDAVKSYCVCVIFIASDYTWTTKQVDRHQNTCNSWRVQASGGPDLCFSVAAVCFKTTITWFDCGKTGKKRFGKKIMVWVKVNLFVKLTWCMWHNLSTLYKLKLCTL